MQSLKEFAGKLASAKDLASASAPRSVYADKYSNGRVVIVGGSNGFHGAPALATNAAYETLAALRIGTGYARTYVPKSIVAAVRKLSPNIIVKPLSGNNIGPRDLAVLKAAVDGSDVIVVGPGLGREHASISCVSKLIIYAASAGKKVVIDADAIHAIKMLKKRLNKNVVVTPNIKEFSFFYGAKFDAMNIWSKIMAAMSAAKMLNANFVLKGHQTIITDGSEFKIAASTSSSLATMGTGDVLSGIIGGYAARNKSMFIASVAGAYLHARIGDLLYKKKGNHILASDVVEYIPKIIKEFDKNKI